MNTWIVGHAPVGYHVVKPHYAPNSSLIRPGKKTFFMKGRIMAGQADLKANLFGLTDFKWLTKEEVKKHVAAGYFSDVEKMMGDR
jgi:large subunit ribosomal protein L46